MGRSVFRTALSLGIETVVTPKSLSYNEARRSVRRRFAFFRPHRLGDQDAALSRPKRGFESPWGHQ